MDAWSNAPYTTVVADFEYQTRLISTMKHECVFEIALANANGDLIVAPTSINHVVTISELCQKADVQLLLPQEKPSRHSYNEQMYYFRSQMAKYYGSANDSETPGLSWEEIADLIDNYTKVAFLRFFV
jgi:hypothetical protein